MPLGLGESVALRKGINDHLIKLELNSAERCVDNFVMPLQ